MENTICEHCGQKYGTFKAIRRGRMTTIRSWKCQNCNPYEFINSYNPVTDRMRYMERSHRIMNSHPEKIKILNECDCRIAKKVKHHPDYDKPFEVELLCFGCHWKAHEEMNPGFNTKDEDGNWHFRTATHTTS